MPSLSAYDQLWNATKQFKDSIGKEDPLAAVKADPAALFRVGGMEPDQSQIELLTCEEFNILVLWTRQFAGKTQSAATMALHNAMTNLGHQGEGSTTLIYSAGLRESMEVLRKVRRLRNALEHKHSVGQKSFQPKSSAKEVKHWKEFGMESSVPKEIVTVKDSQTVMELENGSRIISLPAKAQATIGWTVDLLILDEAKIIPDDLYYSVRSTMALTQGRTIALSTPLGQRGWFWEAWKKCDDAKMKGEKEPYRRFKRTCWECPRLNREWVENERKLIGDYWFRQEYQCEFLDPLGAVFRGEDIERAMKPDLVPDEYDWL